jgi:N-acetylmuramoyl-L-alanine amidase
MRNLAILAAALSLLALFTPRAEADLGATGTRMAIAGGAARFYMTYGHVDEPEIYAPIGRELARIQVTFRRQGEDYLVFHRGALVERWPIVFTKEGVPETGEHPCVLVMGGNAFLPVRKLAEKFGLEVTFDRQTNLLAMVPSGKTGAEPEGPVTLSALALEQTDRGVLVRVSASGAVHPRWSTVRSPLPVRLVLDFPNAKWSPELGLPAPVGDVAQLRTGHPAELPGTARLVLEVPSPEVKLTRVEVSKDAVVASVGRGVAVARATLAPDVEDQVRAAIARRQAGVVRRGSRGSLSPITPLDPSLPQPELPANPVEQPLFPPLPRMRAAADLAGKVIVVDAGHGGHDSGALGKVHREKDLTLKLSREFKRALEERGATVVMTRDADVYVSLQERCTIANNSGADLFISIHLNAMPRPNQQSGSETYFHNGQSRRLAQFMHSRLVGTVRGRDGGIRNRRFYVCRHTTMPSVLLEVGYINHVRDEAFLGQPEFHVRLAESLADGVMEYFGTELAGG